MDGSVKNGASCLSFSNIEIKNVNVKNICRSCLKDDFVANMLTITYKETSLGDIFYSCTNLEVNENDSLTKNLCELCITLLKSFQDFKLQTLKSNKELISLNKIKSECIKEEENHAEVIVDLFKDEKPTFFEDLHIKNNKNDLFKENDKTTSENLSEYTKGASSIENDKNDLDQKIKHWKCKHCNLVLTDVQEIKSHKYLEKQKRIKIHECPYCNKKFESHRLKGHILTHTGERPEKCELCGKGLSSKAHLRKHMMLHTGKKYICHICNKGFTENYLLKSHMNHHEKKKLFICSTCGKTFSTSNELSTHNGCKKRDHFNSGKRISCFCDKCGKHFTNKMNLELHYMNVHDDGKEKKLSCIHCNKKFAHEVLLKKHMIFHNTLYRCRTCLNEFNEPELKSHRCVPTECKSRKIPANECDICGKILKSPVYMERHLESHEKRKCTICDKSFPEATKKQFEFHMNLHTVRCHMCNKGFSKKTSLRAHLENQICISGKSRKSKNQLPLH